VSEAPTLLVDLGNTCIKWALLAGGALDRAEALAHPPDGLDPAVGSRLAELPVPAAILVGSVAGAARNEALRGLCTQLWGRQPRFAVVQAQLAGVTCGYASPTQLGVDRWLGLLAAHADGGADSCVLDCGTAVTIDVIDRTGRHHGGVILPGLHTMRECLLTHTRMPRFGEAEPRLELGDNTAAAVANGALLAIAGAVRETLMLVSRSLGRPPRLLVAGGDGRRVAAALRQPHELRPDLVLEGLAVLARPEGR